MSVDALRGLVMFTMIFVNDLAGVSSRIVPAWMQHFRGRSGMTFVDLVFPAFLFIVGMSIPFALGSRLRKGEPLWKIGIHVVTRTLALLLLGIMMVNEPNSAAMGWSAPLWSTLMFLSGILAFCSIRSGSGGGWKHVSLGLRVLGFAGLVSLAFVFRGEGGQRMITLSPFSINTEWYGILGLIGWAYLVCSIIFLAFRTHRTALLGCMALLFCLYPADRKGAFEGLWLADIVSIGSTLGSQAAIVAGGMLLATILVTPETNNVGSRVRFGILFVLGCAAGAWLLQGLYGINKNSATPSWCLWACAITAAVWLAFYFVSDVFLLNFIARPFSIAGENVLLAYLISEMLPGAMQLLHVSGWYGSLGNAGLVWAVVRSAGCAVVILAFCALLNRAGFRLKL
jgi:heparan-alpha-glucosaminide N-acetyltransferase